MYPRRIVWNHCVYCSRQNEYDLALSTADQMIPNHSYLTQARWSVVATSAARLIADRADRGSLHSPRPAQHVE